MPSLLSVLGTCMAVAAMILASSATASSESFKVPGLGLDLTASLVPLQQYAETPELFPMPACGDFQLEEASIDQMQDAMQNGTLTSVQLAMCYMTRVYQTDDYINSVQQINPDALAIATRMDVERRDGKIRGPLHGIPFVVKDNIATKDQMETTAGSWALLGSIVPRDAHVVSRLRDAGAVLFGKATMSEWADMRSNNYSEGYSARGGQARSPYNLTVNPGGSSSGSAAAVAANVIAFSLGTETDGSVINPAERNAIVGFKPTVGLTSRAGVIPECEHQDTVGTFGRTVKDAVLAFDAIYGVDERDNYTLAQFGKTPEAGYTQFLTNKDSLNGAVFGLPWESFWVYADVAQQATLLSIVSLIEQAGATIINNTEILDYETLVSPDGWNWDWGTTRGRPNESEYTVVAVDFYNNINTYLSELDNTQIHTLEDLIAYNYANDGTEGGQPWPLGNPAFYSGQDGLLASAATKGEYTETYWQALGFTSGKTRAGIDHALNSTPAHILEAGRNDNRGSESKRRYDNPRRLSALLVPPDVGQTYQIAAQAGYPMLTIPAGRHERVDGGAASFDSAATGMPFGLGLMQSAFMEEELVYWGSAIEDLILSTKGGQGGEDGGSWPLGRTRPKWYGYLQRNIPVLNL